MIPSHEVSGSVQEADHDGPIRKNLKLLALYPGLRQSGWALVEARSTPERLKVRIAAAGVAGLETRRKLQPCERASHLVQALESVCSKWQPHCLVRSVAGGVGGSNPGAMQLQDALCRWAEGTALPLVSYPATDVRSAIAGKSNAPRRALGFAIMHRFGLIGHDRSDPEWEAIAVGYYHLLVKGKSWI